MVKLTVMAATEDMGTDANRARFRHSFLIVEGTIT